MDYNKLAHQVLLSYCISNPKIEFIRQNENIIFKVTDEMADKCYLLRIHKSITNGLAAIQHTYEGISSEVKLLHELSLNSELKVQKPVANCKGDYITECNDGDSEQVCYATLLEWIDGEPITLNESNIDYIVFALGERLALFHENTRRIKPEKDFVRPIYDMNRIDSIIEELKYCVDINLFSIESYSTIREVLTLVKERIKMLDAREDAWGIIHADLQLGNILINNNDLYLIDFGFCGFGYYLFDLSSAAIMLKKNLRGKFLEGYASKSSFTFDDIKYIEGFMLMDLFLTYTLFMRDKDKNAWIKPNAEYVCANICKGFLEGKEIFYSF